MISFEFPLKLGNGMNMREHHFARSRRVKNERRVAWAEWVHHVKAPVALPCVVTLTRIAPRTIDTDNSIGSLKGVRDEISKMLGVDDRDARIEWRYEQERGKPRYYGVRITVEPAAQNKVF